MLGALRIAVQPAGLLFMGVRSQSFARVGPFESRARAALILLLLALASAQTGSGQVLQGIIVTKLDEYTQNTSDTVIAGPSDFSGQVVFSVAPSKNAQVTLRAPTGSVLNLQLQANGSYAAYQAFSSRTALNSAFPDGQYVVSVSSGPSATFALITGQPVPPTSITNYAALQSSPNNQPIIY